MWVRPLEDRLYGQYSSIIWCKIVLLKNIISQSPNSFGSLVSFFQREVFHRLQRKFTLEYEMVQPTLSLSLSSTLSTPLRKDLALQ